MRFPRLLSAALAGIGVGAVVATSWNLGQVDADPSAVDTSRQLTERTPSPSARPSQADDAPGAEPEPTAPLPSPTVTYPLLDQPTKPFAVSDFPDEPAEDAPELERIAFELQKVAWNAAGVVDEDTETTCTDDGDEVGADVLSDVGDYAFDCEVSVGDRTVAFDVEADVSETRVEWEWSAARFAVSEEKILHEATRQAFKPSRVTCDAVGMQMFEIDLEDAIQCWVTGPDGEQVTYRGEVVRDGSLVFRRGAR